MGLILSITFAFVSAGSEEPDLFSARRQFQEYEERSWREYISMFSGREIDTSFDVTFYHLAVTVGIESPYIEGSVLCDFLTVNENLDSIRLNLHHSLTVDSIIGSVSGYSCANDTISVFLDDQYSSGSELSCTVYYHGEPELAFGYKGLRYETHGDMEPIIATLSTPFLSHYWWPCKDGPGDKPDSVYIDVTIPDTTISGLPLVVTSNGILEDVDTHDGMKTFKWRERYPIVPYYVMMAISNYVQLDQIYIGGQQNIFDLNYYVFSESAEIAEDGVERLPEAIDLFAGYFGEYPFYTEKYAMSEIGFYGGIENQTNTIIGEISPSWITTIVHELAHMWFGDMITCESWHHGWLNEGFASYCEALWAEYDGGLEAYKNTMEIFEWYSGGTLYLEDDTDPLNIFIGIIYYKGAYVLHMLRGILGDPLFFDCMKAYATDPALRYGHATTEDFQSVCETVSGTDLDFFFDQWVYGEYYPRYRFSFRQDDQSLATTIVIKQVQNSRPYFEMPVQLRAYFDDQADTLFTVWNDAREQEFEFVFEHRIVELELDPDDWILCHKYQLDAEEESFHPKDNTFVLYGIYPNPCTGHATIPLMIPDSKPVSLRIFNLKGHAMRTFLPMPAKYTGFRFIRWDGRDYTGNRVPAGTYIIQAESGESRLTQRFIVLP